MRNEMRFIVTVLEAPESRFEFGLSFQPITSIAKQDGKWSNSVINGAGVGPKYLRGEDVIASFARAWIGFNKLQY
jgi:hypothetical protein